MRDAYASDRLVSEQTCRVDCGRDERLRAARTVRNLAAISIGISCFRLAHRGHFNLAFAFNTAVNARVLHTRGRARGRGAELPAPSSPWLLRGTYVCAYVDMLLYVHTQRNIWICHVHVHVHVHVHNIHAWKGMEKGSLLRRQNLPAGGPPHRSPITLVRMRTRQFEQNQQPQKPANGVIMGVIEEQEYFGQ